MNDYPKKKPRCNSANSLSTLACVQFESSNRHNSSTVYCSAETLQRTAIELIKDFELLSYQHLNYWSGIRTEPLLDQYKALVLFNNKEAQNA